MRAVRAVILVIIDFFPIQFSVSSATDTAATDAATIVAAAAPVNVAAATFNQRKRKRPADPGDTEPKRRHTTAGPQPGCIPKHPSFAPNRHHTTSPTPKKNGKIPGPR
jgi:hypothetical protein